MTAWIAMKAAKPGIKSLVSESHVTEMRNNREYLGAVIDVVRLLGKQGIAFRGHLEGEYSSNKGNFLEVMGLLSKYTPIVEEKQYKRCKIHLSTDSKRTNKNNSI